MLMPASLPTIPRDDVSTRLSMPDPNESFTEDYGETSQNSRTVGGGVDFFSGLGTEHKKKPREERLDPDKVRAFLPSSLILS